MLPRVEFALAMRQLPGKLRDWDVWSILKWDRNPFLILLNASWWRLITSWQHLDSSLPRSFVTCSCQLLESILAASWLLLTILDELFLVYTDCFRSLQERPSLVKNNWETIKKPLRRCQEGPRSVQERSKKNWTCSTNFKKFLVLPTVQESSRSVKMCQEFVTEVAKKYQDINFGTLLVQIRIVGQGPN